MQVAIGSAGVTSELATVTSRDLGGGATFHKLSPGAHRLQFGLRRRRRTWAEVVVSVPVDAHVRVEYQPAVWPWQRAVVTVIG